MNNIDLKFKKNKIKIMKKFLGKISHFFCKNDY